MTTTTKGLSERAFEIAGTRRNRVMRYWLASRAAEQASSDRAGSYLTVRQNLWAEMSVMERSALGGFRREWQPRRVWASRRARLG